MAAANAIVLSSPPRLSVQGAPPEQQAAMTSSPALPSPSQLLSRKAPRLVSGDRESSIPKDAIGGFATASSLLRHSHSIDLSSRVKDGEKQVGKASTTTRKAETSIRNKSRRSSIIIPEEPKKPRKSKAPVAKAPVSIAISNDSDAFGGSNAGSKAVAEKTAILPQAKKSKEPTQTTIKKSRVIKVFSTNAATGDSKAAGKANKTRNVDRVVVGSSVAKEATSVARDGAFDLCLDEATRRRRDWTPTKDTANDSVRIEDAEKIFSALEDRGTSTSNQSINHFGTLLGGYTHVSSSTENTSEITRSSTGEALTKRRKVELVASKICPIPEPTKPKRSKSPKKKPQTVTAKATAPFAALDLTPVNNIQQYLAPDTTARSSDENARQRPPERPKSKKVLKVKAASSKAAKASKPVPILLSPDKALESAMDQQLLFGTSSQLARDDSPTFVRELQQAIKESESLVTEAPQAGDKVLTASVASGSTSGSSLSLFTASRSLWAASARDLDGSLQEAEVIDLSKTPRPQPQGKVSDHSIERPIFAPAKPVQEEASNASEAGGGWTNVDEIPSPEHPHLELDAENLIHRSLAEAALKSRPKSRSPVKKLKRVDKSQEPMAQELAPGMPNFKGFTAEQLKKEVASFGFKPIKKREDQISLLTRCWESKNRIALQSLEPNLNIPQPKAGVDDGVDTNANPPQDASPTKKKRGRPPKTAKASAPHANDETASKPSSPAKPRGRPKKAATDDKTPTRKPAKSPKKPKTSSNPPTRKPTPPPSEISDSDTTPRPTSRRFASSQASLAPLPLASTPPTPLTHTTLLLKIAQAITSYPPTHDMRNLTFYEKILMYDPIVLEDLTAWLNTEGLGKVGVDEEVDVKVVKEWCESQSVCCLWRENLRGGARARW